MILSVLAVIISYLLGSISFSVLMAKGIKGIDIRHHGSGNAGATNTLRVLGKGPGILVLILDILKGVIAVLLGRWLGGEHEWVPALCGLASIIGHNWPVYFRFRGGKGIATTVGVMACLAILPVLCAGVVLIIVVVITRYVSLGSLLLVLLTPIFMLIFGPNGADFWPNFWASVLICVFAFWRHRSNIVKIIQGRENKLGSKGGI
ncbi:acyl-phosphate glycerol 3-phosphate acyltransferase [Paenibacillus yonginensis]|uniref:Glycerol-3-phosphate acyltransferase n=1 Tax=Paenibacillus yonginensis TaxID=1462996 RepID=A0A1B1N0C1_9BACL|nr:glycerol-3-phosphate 1-O-acyltransferase PlsY [Paenibacillus yonginensis]ANS74873.1 acyl-phosphate glycerol 3-phosphate acyltransferase [Paenibacillus yonginensis]